MVSISDAVKKFVLQTPFLEEGLAAGMINLSALARIMRPKIESKLIKNASNGAIIMALKRLADGLQKRQPRPKAMAKYVSDITLRSHLSEFTFRFSDAILSKQIKLLQEIGGQHGKFVTFTSGVIEVTAIVSSDLDKRVEKIFAGEELLSRYDRLSAVILRLTPETVSATGIYYLILKLLSWENINVVEVVSTYTEFIILLDDSRIDQAFSILRSLLLPG
ncbi:MAG: aspartate kinase [Candidatus Aminicenantes bacterium]|nr:aspartate kinase [Candidatus Aminicenantes bacterium]